MNIKTLAVALFAAALLIGTSHAQGSNPYGTTPYIGPPPPDCGIGNYLDQTCLNTAMSIHRAKFEAAKAVADAAYTLAEANYAADVELARINDLAAQAACDGDPVCLAQVTASSLAILADIMMDFDDEKIIIEAVFNAAVTAADGEFPIDWSICCLSFDNGVSWDVPAEVFGCAPIELPSFTCPDGSQGDNVCMASAQVVYFTAMTAACDLATFGGFDAMFNYITSLKTAVIAHAADLASGMTESEADALYYEFANNAWGSYKAHLAMLEAQVEAAKKVAEIAFRAEARKCCFD